MVISRRLYFVAVGSGGVYMLDLSFSEKLKIRFLLSCKLEDYKMLQEEFHDVLDSYSAHYSDMICSIEKILIKIDKDLKERF